MSEDFSPTRVESRPINRGGAGISNQFPRPGLLINSDGFAKANDDDHNDDDDDYDDDNDYDYDDDGDGDGDNVDDAGSSTSPA